MPQPSAFDIAAIEYDKEFTETAVGKLQRQIVWDYLEQNFSTSLNVLEINCGTGVDAAFLASRGYKILATDASAEMINVAKINNSDNDNIQFKQLSFDQLQSLNGKKFDLILSNFGGLNCISPHQLQQLIKQLHNLLSKNGRFIAVVMGNFCAIETGYFLFKLNYKDAFRRRSNEAVEANVSGATVKIWYYSPVTFFDIVKDNFTKVKLKPVGAAIPPSYLNNFYTKNHSLLTISKKVEKILAPYSFAANISDHYLIDLKSI